jgi:membrane protein implicated in regulation of membrane protease activity
MALLLAIQWLLILALLGSVIMLVRSFVRRRPVTPGDKQAPDETRGER